MNKIILDLCGGTGSWSKPYKDAGYDVRLITLPNKDVRNYIPPKDVYGILAAPPCDQFSIAKGSNPRDLVGGMEIVKVCLNIIWQARLRNKLKFWALENPVGFLRQFLGRPPYTFKQWEYGESQVKRTDLWGYFKTPIPSIKSEPAEITTNIGHKGNGRAWSKLSVPIEYKDMKLDRAAIRGITPKGFAEAFYKANK